MARYAFGPSQGVRLALPVACPAGGQVDRTNTTLASHFRWHGDVFTDALSVRVS